MDFFIKDNTFNIIGDNKTSILFDTYSFKILVDGLDVSYPGEYEKGGILLEVKEYEDKLFYSFTIDTKHLVIIPNDKFELKEEILSFFGDVDILVLPGTKEGVTIYENIEARIVIPFLESKDIFLHSLGQNVEEVKTYKLKGELPENQTEFVNLSL